MTVLGATLYAGFFGLAALWLFATGSEPATVAEPDHAQRPDQLNAVGAAASPCCASQSTQQ